MKNIDKTKLSGEDLFYYYKTHDPDYAQDIDTAVSIIGPGAYDKLRDAESKGKRLVLVEQISDVTDPPIEIVIK